MRIPTITELDHELAYRSLKDFTVLHWPIVEPASYIDNWHIDAVCEHLEAVSEGDIKRLLINIPPRHTKSLLTAVMWPAWDWLDVPWRRFLCSSYANSLSMRDSRKCRRIVESELYRTIALKHVEANEEIKSGPGITLVGDQNTKVRYENNHNGVRFSTSVDSANIGFGGDIILVDDAHDIRQIESTDQRNAVLSWWDEVMSTRLNDPKLGAKVVMMQRSHQEDLAGHILERMEQHEDSEENHEDWVHLMLPARFERDRKCVTVIGFEDPRTEEGELLNPDRYDEVSLVGLESDMSPYAVAGQLQQNPVPRKGGAIPVECFKKMKTAEFPMHNIVKSVRYWDKAGTEGGGAFSSGCLMHTMRNGTFVISSIIRGQWGYEKREGIILLMAEEDAGKYSEAGGVFLKPPFIYFEQEPGSGGKESAERTVKMLAGYPVEKDRVGKSDGNKENRAIPFATQVGAGNVFLLNEEPWYHDFINEATYFPRGKYKDQVDSVSGAFNKLTLGTIKRAGAVRGSRRGKPRQLEQYQSKLGRGRK